MKYLYYQFFRNKGYKTVEGVFHEILVDNGYISLANSLDLHKVKWSRATRTDKGVHALANLFSCKINIDKDFIDITEGKNYQKIFILFSRIKTKRSYKIRT